MASTASRSSQGPPRRVPAVTGGKARERSLGAALETIIARGIRSVYQPVVDIDEQVVVGYEALARGPSGTSLEFPTELFAAAQDQQLVGALDHACLLAACQGVDVAGLRAPATLFINIEPEVIDAHVDEFGLDFLAPLAGRLDVFFEVTERSLTTRPAELLETVARLRAAGLGIALDDVGGDPRSLALLPLLRPDIVKLDRSLIHEHPSRRTGETLNGVCAYAEAEGAVIVAEGVESDEHLMAARAMGASLAQGWYFGRPGPLPNGPVSAHDASASLMLPARTVAPAPFDVVQEKRVIKVGTKAMLTSMTRALEAQALELGEHAVVVSGFQHARFFTPAARRRYEKLAARTSLTVALGEEFARRPAPGVHGGSLHPDSPLCQEWDIAVLGPHYAGALVARDLGDDGPDEDRRFAFVLTFERALVVDIVAALIAHLSRGGDPAA